MVDSERKLLANQKIVTTTLCTKRSTALLLPPIYLHAIFRRKSDNIFIFHTKDWEQITVSTNLGNEIHKIEGQYDPLPYPQR